MVYLNEKRRFQHGSLTTPRQRETAEAETLAALSEAQHPQTGEPLFDEVFSLAKRFQCDPVEHQWPDVLGIPAAGFQTRSKFEASGRLMLSDRELTGTHRREGVLLVDAPGAAIGRRHEADLRDVAPTILQLLGLPIPTQMTGRPLSELFSSPAPAAVVSQKQSQNHNTASPISAAQQQAVESRLRDLGYLD